MNLISNDFVGGTRPCVLYMAVWYCFHSHCSLVVGMVMGCIPVSKYKCVRSFCVSGVYIHRYVFYWVAFGS